MFTVLVSLLFSAPGCLRTRAAGHAEILALRHQVFVVQRSCRGNRIHLGATDRGLWVWVSRLWTGWRSALVIIKPETVIAWHLQGFRYGRVTIPQAVHRYPVKSAISWTPRIRGELMKLGIQGSQATVATYMVRHRKPPS